MMKVGIFIGLSRKFNCAKESGADSVQAVDPVDKVEIF